MTSGTRRNLAVVGVAVVVVVVVALVVALVPSSAPRTSAPAVSAPHTGKPTEQNEPANVYKVPASINATCTADDTDALGAWLYSIPDGTPGHDEIAELGKNACYEVDGEIWWRNAEHDIVLDGNGADLEQSSLHVGEVYGGRDNPAVAPYCGSSAYMNDAYTAAPKNVLLLALDGGCDLTIEDLDISGTYSPKSTDTSARQPDSFITLYGTQRVLVKDVTERGTFGDFVSILGLHEAPGGGGGMPATNVTIEGCHFEDAGRTGISETNGAHRVLIMDNTFDGAALTMFDIELDVTYPAPIETDIDITHNTIVGQNYAFLLSAQTGSEVQRVAFTDNKLIDGAQMRFFFAPHDFGGVVNNSLLVEGNTCTASSTWPNRSPVTVYNTVDVLVANNVDPLPSYGGTGRPFALVGKGNLACGDRTPTGQLLDQPCPIAALVITAPIAPALPL